MYPLASLCSAENMLALWLRLLRLRMRSEVCWMLKFLEESKMIKEEPGRLVLEEMRSYEAPWWIITSNPVNLLTLEYYVSDFFSYWWVYVQVFKLYVTCESIKFYQIKPILTHSVSSICFEWFSTWFKSNCVILIIKPTIFITLVLFPIAWFWLHWYILLHK